MADKRTRPGNRPVEQQERSPRNTDATRPVRRSISGPGAADFLAAPGALDRPESGTKGMAQTRDDGFVEQIKESLVPRLGPDEDEGVSVERDQDADAMRGSTTGTIGGGGFDAHNPSPDRAIPEKERDGR